MLELAISVMILLVLGAWWLRFALIKQVKELSLKTSFAVASENIMKVEMEQAGELGSIATNFNVLANKYHSLRDECMQLGQLEKKHRELSGVVNQFESSISQITLITDIGKDITSSLGLKEILTKINKYIISSMVAHEVRFLIEKQNQKMYFVIRGNELIQVESNDWTSDKDNIVNWVFNNNQILVLKDAQLDYKQYVFKEITLYDQQKASSVLCIPFGFNTKQTGSVAVLSTKPNAFDSYHLDFVRSLASYIAVAIDNSNLFEELDEEKSKSDGLLLNILPVGVVNELKERGTIEPKQFDHVSVLFTDMVNFTGISEKMSPTELVYEIHRHFTAFDSIIEQYGLEKIKTIGDAYLAVCGLPNETTDHAIRVANAALAIRQYMHDDKGKFQIRIGIHSGPVVAGIVGVKKYAYDIWGDTVNMAARMEQNSEAGKINISGATHKLIENKFGFTYRGKIEAKNKGELDMYFLDHSKA